MTRNKKERECGNIEWRVTSDEWQKKKDKMGDYEWQGVSDEWQKKKENVEKVSDEWRVTNGLKKPEKEELSDEWRVTSYRLPFNNVP